jgi:hypothetical protein
VALSRFRAHTSRLGAVPDSSLGGPSCSHPAKGHRVRSGLRMLAKQVALSWQAKGVRRGFVRR